ncbi:TPA: hypothetical protein QDB24_002196 [Burkholderia vietnamiensis]|uniref:hypothetical protein n=1 Tax=Burkholderia vietnamiensis TaxID=60552 RepID=UPI001593888D|nr:hypothetical protein [Burkholderia vietnamiensis]MBR7910124.1 hypothetical protein [Burkholderia vietnamiensis]HDR9098591.1 hypothetical protein [Burkholderia vietnamiensis]HDR9274136.1 hypothetical protein [Burkholderia vietnamiensis]
MTMEAIVMIGPTITNPEKLDTVEDLRRELQRVNRELFEKSALLAKVNATGIQMAGFIEGVLKEHVRADADAVAARCASYLDGRPRLREKLEESIQSDAIRTTH